jgi:phage tail-like protein
MRGAVDGLPTPYPIGTLLPGILQEDEFAMRFTAGLDDTLAPIIATLDCIDAYVDPELAPDDFIDWLAQWVGVELDENWPLDRRRRAVIHAVALHRTRGTAYGLRAHLELATGGRAHVVDSGGTAWSRTPGGRLPGERAPRLAVRVTVRDPATVKVAEVDEIVTAAKPAYVVHQVEVVAG